MKSFAIGFELDKQYHRHPVIAEDEEKAKELLREHYKKLGLTGKAEILEILSDNLFPYWVQDKAKGGEDD